jgi:hypothetical protein
MPSKPRPAQHTDAMVAASLTPMIDRNYTYSHAFQWVREAVVNSAQAGATDIVFTTEWEAVNTLGVHRRIIVDNGPGIPFEDMLTYLNALGGSGKTVAATAANYGFGLKTSLLPWNEHGVVLLSRHADDSGETSTYMVWLRKDHNTDDPHGTYGARRFKYTEEGNPFPVHASVVRLEDFGDEFYLPVVDGDDTAETDPVNWTKVFPAKQKTGFAIVLLGNDPTQDTILGDPDRDEAKKYGMTAYLNARFWEFPIEIRALQYENLSDRSAWPTAPINAAVVTTDEGGVTKRPRQHRSGKGLKHVIEGVFGSPSHKFRKRGIVASDYFEIAQSPTQPGARVHWWLFTEAIQQRGDLPTAPLSAILHESHPDIFEVYDLASMGEHSAAVSAKTRMSQFVSVGAVRDRLSIIVEPIETKQYAIYPNLERTGLKFEPNNSGAQVFTWEGWVQAWKDNLPGAVKEAIDAYYEEQAEKTDSGDDLRDLIDFGTPFVDRLNRVTVPVGSLSSGALVGTHRNPRTHSRKTTTATAGTATRKKATTSKQTPETGVEARRRKALSLGLITCTAVSEPEEDFTVRYDDNAKQTVLNTASPVYTAIVDAIVTEYVTAGRIEADDASRRALIVNEVRRQSLRHLTLGGSHAVGLASHNPDEARAMLSNHALQAMLYGVRHLETLVAKPLGQCLGGDKIADVKAIGTKARKSPKAA